MIDHSLPRYVFIRACIFTLRAISPVSCLYTVTSISKPSLFSYVPWPVNFYFIAEAAFATLVYLPLRLYLQSRPAKHPKPFLKQEREELFLKCSENTPDPERWLQKWCLDAPIQEIKRGNLKEWLAWGFFSSPCVLPESEEELDGYVVESEKLLERRLADGRGEGRSLRLTIDKVDMLQRPLAWYCIVGLVDNLTSAYLLARGFRFHHPTPRLRSFLTLFPFRPFHLFSPHSSPSSVSSSDGEEGYPRRRVSLSYWHRPHTSKSRLPILFIHGIGIGLFPYAKFLAEINNGADDEGGQIGIIAIELLPISFRITTEMGNKISMCNAISAIVSLHGWEKFVLVAHSYGSVTTTHLLHDETIAPKVGPILLIDPITFLLHLPDVAYNFTHRSPRKAPEHQLHYFASKDPLVAHTLHRHFFWSENIVWPAEVLSLGAGASSSSSSSVRKVTVALAGKDIIVDTDTVGAYLNGELEIREEVWKHQGWTGAEGRIETMYFPTCDHAQVFEGAGTRAALVGVVRRYCEGGRREGEGVGDGD